MEEKPPLVTSIEIPPFRIDPGAGCVWRGAKALSLRPKAWAVLLYLLERRGLLVSRAELQAAVWADAEVCDDNITQSIAELRRVLDDDVRRPRYIETMHRRGYRFIGPVGSAVATASSSSPSPPAIVNRDAEIATLLGLLRKAGSGSRQVAFVIGEPGIGKTSVVDAFLTAAMQTVEPPLAARGQSVEHYGQHEPFGPMIEALDRLVSGPERSAVLSALKRFSPTWHSELASTRPAGGANSARSAAVPTPGKMLREIAVALEALTSDRTLVLVLEDLHWADPSTVDVISVLAQRAERARLLIVATYRPAEAAVRDHPIPRLRRTLEHRARCVQIALEPLPRKAVQTYLGMRFANLPRADEIGDWVHRRTEGNPLFVVALVDYLTSRGALFGGDATWSPALTRELENEVPETLRGMIETQLEALEPRNRDVLEAACAVGAELDAQCVAAALETRVGEVDSTLDDLARTHGLLRVTGEREWPDGSAGGRYVFGHVLYRQTLYACLPPAVRREMHQRIAQRLEAGFGERGAEVAAELAHHFERGGDRPRAIEHLLRGAERALDRAGVREASSFLDAAEPLLAWLPASVERDRQELVLLRLRAIVLSGISGYAAAGLEEVLERYRTLAADMKDDAKVFEATRALWYLHGKRGEGEATWALVEELRRLSTRLDHRRAVLADAALGTTAVWAGNLEAARDALERVEAEVLAGRITEFEGVGDYSVAPFVEALSHFAHTLWLLGDGARAREVRRVSLAAAERLGHGVTLCATLEHASLSALVSGDTEEADALSRRGIALRIEHGLDEFNDLCTLFGGAARVQAGRTDEGLAMVREGLERYTSTAARLASPMFGALAACCLQSGEIDEGLAVVERALDPARSTLDRMFEAELWRLKGELLLARDESAVSPTREGHADAEACLERALATSRAQSARGLELRAAVSLARLWQARGDAREASNLLAPIVAFFGEVLDTPDLCEAGRLLQELSGEVLRERA